MMETIIIELGSIIYATIIYMPPLAYAGIGSCFSESSGVSNIGIEGMMTIGAFTGCVVAYFTENFVIGLLCAGLAGLLLSLIHAIASITINADQTISGTAINLIGPGIAIVLSYILFGASDTAPLKIENKIPIMFLNAFDDTVFGKLMTNIFSTYLTTYILIIVIIVSFFIFYKTKFGLRLRACGEHPKACETLGINVIIIRYICVLISGFLSGIGGACITMSVANQFRPSSIIGQGFIAMAAVIFGKYNPLGVVIGCLLFGFAQGLRVVIPQSIVQSNILAMLPYIITICVLIFTSKNSSTPKAIGKPYFRGK